MGEETYFSAVKTDTAIALAKAGLRKLDSAGLMTYWDYPSDVADDDLADRYAESFAFRSGAGIPPVAAAVFSTQMSRSFGQETFVQYLNEMGIESKYEEDVTEEVRSAALPDMGALTEVVQRLQAKGYVLVTASLAARYKSLGVKAGEVTVKHLNEPLPSVWADEDTIIAARLARARAYAFAYLGGEI